MQPDWLTQTKFIPPRLRGDFVARTDLLERLHGAASTHPLTLISAPAGYGKTTLLTSLAVEFPDLPIAWIALEEEDNDPARFIGALIRALQQLDPARGTTAHTLLGSLPNPAGEARRIVGTLINEALDDLLETWIVLDDLHLIREPAVHAALDYWLERMPPHMHLLIATRHDPPLSLARLRARGQVAELRAADLRFTNDEAKLFLNDRQHLDLSPDDLIKLQSRAEGWAVGLRLLAASLDRISSPIDRTAFIDELALVHRHVFDFLAAEVLKRQDSVTRTFLLETSILSEVDPALCNALMKRDDAQSRLEELYRRNLFLVQADGIGRVFRYHALFAEFLRQQLRREDPDRFAALHRLAAQAQETVAPGRAIAHYLAAEQWDDAGRTIEQASDELLRQGLLRTVRSWIELLPLPMRLARPRLLYLLGFCALERGDLEHAMRLLEQARRGFAADGDLSGQGETLLSMIDTANRQHDYALQAALAHQARGYPLPVHGQAQLLMAQVWQSLLHGDMQGADQALGQALDLGLAANDLRGFSVITPLLTMHLAYLPRGIARIEAYCRHVLATLGPGAGPLQMGAHSLLGYLLFLKGSVEEAVRQAERAQVIAQQIGGLAYLDAQIHYVMANHLALRGNFELSEQYWARLLPWVEQTPAMQPYQVAVLFIIGRMQWLQRKFDGARQTGARIAAIPDSEEYPEVAVARRLMGALIEISDQRESEAEGLLQQSLAIERQWRHAGIFGSAGVLLTYLYCQQKREKEAWTLFAPLLMECERRGTPGLLLQEAAIAVPGLRLAMERRSQVEFAGRLLAQLDVTRPPARVTVPETGETLTPREVEVLQLIADGASNQDVARRLVISENTVKVHVTNLFAKMNAASRTQAAARARELRLV